jgi:putative SOS response-associated peptidase YedK
MCGRFTLTTRDFRGLAAELDVSFAPDVERLYRPRYNIAPTDQHWIVRTKREQRELLRATWGLVNSWAPDAKGAARQINCRAETAMKRAAFRDAFVRRRCVVPADGFFEWRGTKEARQPVWYHHPDGAPLLFAGLYESWHDQTNDVWHRTFTILTTAANDVVRPVHDRMPVILPQDRIDDWMHIPSADAERHAEGLTSILQPAGAGGLIATDVSRRVNSVANDDPECLEPAGDAELAAQRSLL